MRILIDVRVVDLDLSDLTRVVVPQSPDDRVAFLVDQERCRARYNHALDCIPDLEQIVEIPAQLLDVAADAGGAHDATHVFRRVEFVE